MITSRMLVLPMALCLLIMFCSCFVHKENEWLAEFDGIPDEGVKVGLDLPYRGIAWKLSVALDGKTQNDDSEVLIEILNESDAAIKLTLPEENVFSRIDVGHKEKIWRGRLKELRELPLSIPFSFYTPQNGGKSIKLMMFISSSDPIRFSSGPGIIVQASSTDGL